MGKTTTTAVYIVVYPFDYIEKNVDFNPFLIVIYVFLYENKSSRFEKAWSYE